MIKVVIRHVGDLEGHEIAQSSPFELPQIVEQVKQWGVYYDAEHDTCTFQGARFVADQGVFEIVVE